MGNHPAVKLEVKALGRKLGAGQKQARGLGGVGVAAIMATARTPRRGRGGILESAEAAHVRGNLDIALVLSMSDGLLRISEAASMRWAHVEPHPGGSARLYLPKRKTDQEGRGSWHYLTVATAAALETIRPADADGKALVFGLTINALRARIAAAARAAGLGNGFSGHSLRVGSCQDLTALGAGMPELIQAGGWASSEMPARYAARESAARGAVARYFENGQRNGYSKQDLG